MGQEAMPFSFQIFDGPFNLNEIPEGFTAVTIQLEAGQKSDLDWQEALSKADEAISKGYKIFWDLQLGLFSGLPYPLSNQAQFRCLALAITHFSTSVWEKFQDYTVGVCLYRGSAIFSDHFSWGTKETENFQNWLLQTDLKDSQNESAKTSNSSLYCQNVSIDFIKLIAEQLPNEAEPFVLLHISERSSLLEEAMLRDSSLMTPLRLALQGNRIPLYRELAWNNGQSPSGYISKTFGLPSTQEISLAVCIPSTITYEIGLALEELFQNLLNRGLIYRLIAEDRLSVEWDGLDGIIVLSNTVTPTGKRMLQGFCAAGGKIIHLGGSLNLPEEIPFVEFLSSNYLK